MNNLFNTLLTSIKYRFTGFVTRIKMLTNPNYIKNKIWGGIRNFFMSLFDVRPKDEHDYYSLFGWLVSKKLAYAIVIIIGVISLTFLFGNRSTLFNTNSEDGIKTYEYNSLMLRFAKGNVRINGKSGYLAYEGQVEKGKVTGTGTLYDIDGRTVYTGQFLNNEYSGNGQRYYKNGNLWYSGDFKANEFEGTGLEYRINGSQLYQGEFSSGMKHGHGSLYDNGNNIVYTGDFAMNEILYSSLIGKTAEQVSESYSGSRILYESSDMFDVYMPDIEAIYVSRENEDALDDSMKVDTVYVVKNVFPVRNDLVKNIKDLQAYFGDAVYEGYSDAEVTELLCMSFVRERTGDAYYDDPHVMMSEIYEDYLTIDSYKNMTVYLYSFDQGGLRYTFVSRDKGQPFGFYYIESIGKGMSGSNSGNADEKTAESAQ